MSQKSKPTRVSLRSTPEDTTAKPEETATPARDFENLGELPHSYGEDSLFLVAQEPHWLFCYWDLDIAKHPGGPAHLRYHLSSGELEGEIEVPFETRNWYVPVTHADTEYFVEIGYYRADQWTSIARSITVATPPEGMSPSDDFAFATVPFHLSFQRLVDNLENAFQSGEDLVDAVARMQKTGDFSAFGPESGDLSKLNPLALLAALAGPEFLAELSSSALDSGELHSRLQSHLDERLGSEASASFTGGSGTAFDATDLASGSFASELLAAFSSWSPAEVSSWLQAAAGSWTTAVGGESSLESLTAGNDWSSLGGPTSWTFEALSSWLAGIESSDTGLASWLTGIESSGSTLSSWLQSAETSGFPVTLSSWLQGVHSSWAQVADSSWTPAGDSSWDSASSTSWGRSETSSWGGSDALSSLGSPFGAGNSSRGAEAEIILRGGDPQTKISIGGHRAHSSPDGALRHQFKFPNDGFEIPITASNPNDGKIRKGTLSLKWDSAD
ncbi:MAG: DUF4912 domain-containing protein [Chthoniobacterales bacterium]